MQSEFSEAWMNILRDFTFKTEVGESTTVDYFDNSLDTVHLADITTETNVVGNQIELVSEVGLGDVVGDDINSALVKMDINGSKAINKILHTPIIDKDDKTRIIYRIKMEFIPFTE